MYIVNNLYTVFLPSIKLEKLFAFKEMTVEKVTLIYFAYCR